MGSLVGITFRIARKDSARKMPPFFFRKGLVGDDPRIKTSYLTIILFSTTNDAPTLEAASFNTMFAAGPDSQRAFAMLFEGDRWMIPRNSITNVLYYDFVRVL